MASALVAAVVAGFARPVVLDLIPEDQARSVRRFAAGARDVEVDPRPRWARIPRVLPGPADAWAGGTSHALRFPLGPRPPRRLNLYLDTDANGEPVPRLTLTVNGAPVTTVALSPGARTRVRIPASALGATAPLQLALVNESGPAVTWRRIRLAEADARFVWGHLARRGRFPPESAVVLAASLGALLASAVGPSAGPRSRRLLGAIGPAAGLGLLGVALALPPDAFLVARVPRWAWLLLPWAVFAVRPRPRTAPLEPRPAPPSIVRRLGTVAVNGLLALGALAASLAFAEVALRLVFRDVRSASDTRTYFHRTYALHLTYAANSLGFHEREFPLAKPPGTYRLAVIGDSITAGGGVATPERFSNLLGRRLNESGRPGLSYEVLNFGRVGADTEQEVRTLRRLVLGTEPDFVLLQWYVNDVENGEHRGRPTAWPMVPSVRLHAALLRSSALYSLLDPHWGRLQEMLGVIEPHSAYMYRRFGDPDGPDSLYATARLEEFIRECREHRTPVGLVLFPRVAPDLVAGTYEYGYLHDRVLEVCREQDITCVDLRGPFAAPPDYRQLWVTPLDGHPSALANRIATDRLMEAFGDRWLAGR